MKLADLSLREKDELADQYGTEGMAVAHDVDLPTTFVPPRADFVFLRLGNSCEVYFSATVRYTGLCGMWQRISRGRTFAGNAKLIDTTQGDVFTALQSVIGQLAEAGGVYEQSEHEENGHTPAESALAPLPQENEALAPALQRPVNLATADLFNELQSTVRGQSHVLRTLSRRISRHVARQLPRRPATFFAVGPSGVGKTSTAEALRTALGRLLPPASGFGYLRIDANEYSEQHHVNRLLGAPPGYVGYGDGGELNDALQVNPRLVILFDEVEKAHPTILRVLLNLLDAGRLSTPDRGRNRRAIDARQSILFFTTNLRSEAIGEELGTRRALNDAATVDAVCRQHLCAAGLAPELVGRIGSFLVFSPLTRSARAEIIGLAISRVASEYGVQITDVSQSALESILAGGAVSDLGARPDEYLVDELLGDAFSAAARQHGGGRWRISGPPFLCEQIR